MKSVTIVLLIASLLLMIMGIFLIVVSRSSKEKVIRASIVNGIGNLVLGTVGAILAVIYQFITIDKEIMIGIFLGSAILISIIQLIFKRNVKNK